MPPFLNSFVKVLVILLTLVVGSLYSVDAFADSKATQIIRKGETHLRGKTTQALMVMKIKRPEYTRILSLRSWTVGNHRALVEILTPTKEEGVSSLRVKNNMWNYLPKVDQVVRVPTSLMLQSWMGSDFTNDDLMKASSLVRDYRHRIAKREKLGKHNTIQIRCTPKPNAPVVWGKILYWARTSDLLPVQQKFYDEDGTWVRTIRFDRFKKMDDRIIPTLVTVRTAEEPKNVTIVTYKKLLYDRAIGDHIFNKEHLRQTSQKGTVLTAGWSFTPLKRVTRRSSRLLGRRQ